MILGVGTDIVQIARIQKAIENPRFFERVYTVREREIMRNFCPERLWEHAAGLFSAKEAVAKAFGTGFVGFGFSDIEILPDEMGRPVVHLHENACRKGRIHVSIAHSSTDATAFAIWEEEENI